MWTLIKDVRFGLRVLRNSPGLTVVAVITLALGIAANTTVFSWVDGILWHPYPGCSDSGRLAVMEMISKAPNGGTQVSYIDYRDYRKTLTSISGIALRREDLFGLGEALNAQPVWGELVTGNYFSVLGVRPQIGRMFTQEEDGEKLGAYPVAVIGDSLWRNRFHGDPEIVGKTIRVNRHDLTVVGVTPPQFIGAEPALSLQLWVPMTMGVELGMLGDSTFRNRGSRNMFAIVRLKPGVNMTYAAAEAASVARNLAVTNPKTNEGLSATVLPPWRVHSGAADLLLDPLRILMAVALLVLLIVCANVANLLLGRSVARQREFGIRMALGSSRWRLARQLLIETLLLAAAGALAGLSLTSWMAESIAWMIPNVGVPVATGSHLNWHVLTFTILCCGFAALVSGAAPALLSSRSDVNDTLKEGGRGGTLGGRSHRLSNLLVVAEVALAAVVLINAGLFGRSFQNVRTIYPGFEKNHVLVARFFLSGAGYSDADVERFCLRLRDGLETVPGVMQVSYADFAPLGSTAGPWDEIAVDGYVPAPGEYMTVNRAEVAPGYFKVMRIAMLDGRDFFDREDPKAAPAIVVNEAFARRYFHGKSPIGRSVKWDGAGAKIVGLVRDSKYFNVAEAPRPFFYVSAQHRYRARTEVFFFVRTSFDPIQAAASLRQEVASVDRNIGSFYVMPLSDWTELTMLPQKMAASLLGGLGLISLILAAIGLYSVMAYAVGRRTQEIGVRMALGAHPRDVLRDVLRRGMLLTGVGLGSGVVAALVITRLAGSMLVRVDAADPMTFGAATLFLGLVALLANYIPAVRATRIDPIVALRCE